MKQCEIWDVNFNPTKGKEQKGIRPAVIISGNAMNDHYSLVIVCPITSKIKNLMGNLVVISSRENGLKTKSEILTFHIKSISKERLISQRGVLPMEAIDTIIKNLNEVLRL